MPLVLLRLLSQRLAYFKTLILDAAYKAKRRFTSTEDIFTEIYRQRKWGASEKGEDFHSGLGTTQSKHVEAYISAVKMLANQKGFSGGKFVDIGCGDFQIGSQLVPFSGSYIGLDVVKSLIDRNKRLFGSKDVIFQYADAAQDSLPQGDICFLRQVLQHLSNKQIATILRKVSQYQHVLITEHVPLDSNLFRSNLDKVPGADIRVNRNSGVYLDKDPFNIPASKLTLVLEVPGTYLGPKVHPGVIRTWLYEPSNPT
jgi:SAM-dependent methyltransferase